MAKVLIEQADLDRVGVAVAELNAASDNVIKILSGINVEVPTAPAPVKLPGGVVVGKPSGHVFSQLSLDKMEGVDSRLIKCTKRALQLSLVDFGFFEGLRTRERQKQLVAKGASRTMQSKHIDGLACDLVPFIGGKLVWDWDGCAKIAFAMDQAATELGIADLITWGGAWDRKLSDYGGRLELYMHEVEKYKARHVGSDFIDGPHFEILGPRQ